MTSITYVIPAYNEAATLPATIELLVGRLAGMPGSEVIIVENGSRDDTAAVAGRLAASHAGPVPVVATSSAKGLGNALRKGLELASADWVCCTAADLPFAFSDLDAFLAASPTGGIVIGSKAHPDSHAPRSVLRRSMTAVFRVARLVTLGMRVRDPQGSVFVERSLGQRLGPRTQDAGFLFGTELVALAQTEDAPVREVPVVLEPLRGGSTVRPVQDSMLMLAGLVRLRRRVRTERAHQGRLDSQRADSVFGRGTGRRRGIGLLLAVLAVVLGATGVALVHAALGFITIGADELRDGDGILAARPQLAAYALAALVATLAAAAATVARLGRRSQRSAKG